VANRLTGDFEAVLELSGATLDRLAASMHQNGFGDPERPSLPHVAFFRLGVGGGGVDDPRGSVSAQIGVPHVVLIDGATDRFGIEFGLRARYRPDPGSVPLADVIHGTVRAEFSLQDIDSRCPGWHELADQYLWLRLVDDSVAFEGHVYKDADAPPVAFDEGAVKAVITQQLALLLETTFAANPQRVGERFRHGFRCMVTGAAEDHSAVAFPVALSGGSPAGDVESIDEFFLDQSDFGLAVSSDYVIAQIESQLQGLPGFQRDFHVHGDAGWAGGLEIDYHVRLDAVGAQWLGALVPSLLPPGLEGVIAPGQGAIRIDFDGSGWATSLYRSGVYNVGSVSLDDLRMTFNGNQLLALSFDPGAESFHVAAFGAPSVSVNYGGPNAAELIPIAQRAIAAQIQGSLDGPLRQAQEQLDTLTGSGQKGPLVDQLSRIDAAASLRFDEAVFVPQGVIVRGTIGLAPRQAPQVAFERTKAGDGFSAIQSWIPGGRIDAFDWTWRWFNPNPVQPPPGPAGSEDDSNDFLLRRAHRGMTKFQMSLFGDKPLPGIDGNGSVCLTIKGVQVDPTTGALMPVERGSRCEQFQFDFHIPVELAPVMRFCDSSGKARAGRFREIAQAQAAGPGPTSNMLAVYMGAQWEPKLFAVLAAGLDRCRRLGAGLLVLLLFDDGALSDGGNKLGAKLKAAAAKLEAPVLAAEDADKGWSLALALPQNGHPSWRLMRPDGGLAWAVDGAVKAKDLASVLDKRLVAGHPPVPSPVQPSVPVNNQVPVQLGGPGCPPVPLSRPGSAGSRLIFIREEQSAALGQLKKESVVGSKPATLATAAKGERLLEEAVSETVAFVRDLRGRPLPRGRAAGDLFVAAVVSGASSRDAKRLSSELELDFPIFPDPSGALSRQAGVRLWPTTLMLDHVGRLTDYHMGVDAAGGGRR
jgi:hypothetical protein